MAARLILLLLSLPVWSGCLVNTGLEAGDLLRCGAGQSCLAGFVCASDGVCRRSDIDAGLPDGGCQATTCVAAGAQCGTIGNQCGGSIDCGPCPMVDHGSASCVSNQCDLTCDGTYHSCGNQCLADDSVDSCGTRCTPCPAAPAGGATTCETGQCGFACLSGFCRVGDACRDKQTDPENCGICGKICAAGTVCVGGDCRPPPRMLLFGGVGSDGNPLGDVWQLSLPPGGTPAWSKLEPSGTAPTPRSGSGLVYDPTGDRALFFGGELAGGAASDEVWALNLRDAPAWTLVSATGVAPARTLAAVAFDGARDRLLVTHGNSNTGDDCQNDAQLLTLDPSPSWASAGATGAAPRAFFNGVGFAYDGPTKRLFLHGGEGGAAAGCLPCCPYFNDTYVLSMEAASPAWSAISPAGQFPPGSGGTALVWDPVGMRLVRFGGRSQHGVTLDSTWVLSLSNPASPIWVDASGSTRPPARGHAAAVHDAAGSRLLLFGGEGPAAVRDDLWALDLSTSTTLGEWTQPAVTGTPPPGRARPAFVYVP